MKKRVVKKKDADRTKAELLVELDATQGQVSRLKDIVKRYERVADRRDMYRSLYDLEVKKDSVDSLLAELREKQMEVDLQGEELEVMDEELRVQLEEINAKDDNLLKARAALREREERYRSLFNVMYDGVAFVEVIYRDGKPFDYRFIDMNPAFEQGFMLTRDQILGRTMLEFYQNQKQRIKQTGDQIVGRAIQEVYPEPEQYWFDFFIRVDETGEPGRFLNYSSLTNRWIDIYAYSLRKGQIIFLRKDVTDHKLAEEALRESEELSRMVLYMSRDGLYRFNYRTGLMDYFSPSVARILGYTVEELVGISGATVQSMLHPDDVPGVLAAIKQLEITGEASAEYREMQKKVSTYGYRIICPS